MFVVAGDNSRTLLTKLKIFLVSFIYEGINGFIYVKNSNVIEYLMLIAS